MKIGTLVYRTKTGLGYQARDYVNHLNIDKVLVVDLSRFNNLPLTDWYPDAQTVYGYPKTADLIKFLEGLDVILLAETPLNYELYTLARQRNIKTAVVINWEFFDHLIYPQHPLPDLFIMPSLWHFDEAYEFAKKHGRDCIYLHHPVDRSIFTYRQRETAKFYHVAGNPAAHDRNGTWDYLKADPSGTVTTQAEVLANHIRRRYRHARVKNNILDARELYNSGDVMVLPRRYGGNCLPLNEALSSGCPVIMPDISPNSYLLPNEWLVPATVAGTFTPRTAIELYSVDENLLREKLEWFRSVNIKAESERANQIADTISWANLKDKYLAALR